MKTLSAWFLGTALIVIGLSPVARTTPVEVLYSEPQRELLRLKDSLVISPITEPGQAIFFLLDTEASDPKVPYRNLISRCKFSFSFVEGPRITFLVGGLELQKALLSAPAFAEPISYRAFQTNVLSSSAGAVTNIDLVTNTTLVRHATLYTNIPHYAIEVQLVDGTEEPTHVKSRRTFGSFLLGSFMDSLTLEGAFRFRKSVAHVQTIATIYDFRSGKSRAQGSVRTHIIRKERGGSFSVRYSSRAAASYDADDSTAVTFEAALTEGVTLAFAQALANLYGIPLSKFSNQPDNERNRTSVEGAWIQASPEQRQRACSIRNRLAADCGLVPEILSSPLAATRWRELIESPILQLPCQPFDRYPLAKLGRNEYRVVFEQFPIRRWSTLRGHLPDLLGRFPDTIVQSESLEREIGFRVRHARGYLFGGTLDPQQIGRFLSAKLHSLTGSGSDFQIVGKTIYIKFRGSLPTF